jgi:broad specificity phosphatase PhoE
VEIVLARHGRPILDEGGWITPRGLADWIHAYDGSGIVVREIPLAICAKAAGCGVIVSSSLTRCIESARVLAPSREILPDETLREAGLPYPSWGFPKLPPSVWTVLLRVAWFLGYSANSESLAMAKSRAEGAAARLIELAREYESVFVMGHGIMTALTAKELVDKGWLGIRRPTHGYWQFSVYQK